MALRLIGIFEIAKTRKDTSDGKVDAAYHKSNVSKAVNCLEEPLTMLRTIILQ